MSTFQRLMVTVLMFLILNLSAGKVMAVPYNLQVGDLSLTYTDLGDAAPVYSFTAANNIYDWITFSSCSLNLSFTDGSTVFENLTLTDTLGNTSIAPGTPFTLGPKSTIDTGAYGYGTISSAVFMASVDSIDGFLIGSSRFYSSAQTITATLVPTSGIVDTWFDLVPLNVVGELREPSPAPVPEPGTSMLVGVGLVALAWSLRSRCS